MLDEDAVSRIWGPCNCNGGNWITKIVAEKIWNKFSKLLDEDTISQIRGSWDYDGGNWVTKIAARKIELTFSIFSAAIYITQFSPLQSQDPEIRNIASLWVLRILNFQNCRWGKLGDENHGRKNWKCRFDFFGCDFRRPTTHILHTPPFIVIIAGTRCVTKIEPKKSKTSVWFFRTRFSSPPSALQLSQDPQIRDIDLCQTFLGIYSSQYRIRGSGDCDGSGWVGVTKIAAEKIGNVDRELKKMFKLWMRQVARPSHQTSSHSA